MTAATFAILENRDGVEIVSNIVLAEPAFAAAKGWPPASTAKLGDVWDGKDFRSPEKSVPTLRQDLREQVTALSRQHETGGLTLPGGVRVATGVEDQNRITSVIANAELAGVESMDFKAESGWVTLSLDQVRGIAAAVALHVHACYAAERAHHDAIAAASETELMAYDINTGWPA